MRLLLFCLLPALAFAQPAADTLRLPKLTPVAIAERQFQAEFGVTYVTLANGLQVALRPVTGNTTNPADSSVYIKLERLYQPTAYSGRDLTTLRIASYLVRKSGVANLNARQLESYLKSRRMYMTPTGNRLSTGVDLQTGKSQLEAAFQVLHAFVTQPSADTSAYRAALTGLIAGYRRPATNVTIRRAREPSLEEIVSDTLRHVLNCPADQLTADNLADISPGRAYALFREAYGNANQIRCTIAGNFELEAVIRLLQQYPGNWPSSTKKTRLKLRDDCSFPVSRLQKVSYLPKAGSAVVSEVLLTTYRTVVPGETNLVDVFARVFQKRLSERLKQGGLSNQVLVARQPGGIVNGVSRQNRRVGVLVKVTCQPEQVNGVKAVLGTELKRLLQEPITDAEAEPYKARAAQNEAYANQSGYFWNLLLWTSIYAGDWPMQSNTGAKVATAKHLQDTARRFATTRDVISLTFLPESRR
ncbi:insulinase family protein [Fibrisoma montanum]|uniref:Insulinase family protein n=1 Tax=Fibrisoma montanum TaxID=2305895 RepID=A0A418LZ12_9BACT|nr:insulinase family protein [Fibrisoma montanum]RIV18462.1 insulinase family protein [Fibrisoma montanum]